MYLQIQPWTNKPHGANGRWRLQLFGKSQVVSYFLVARGSAFFVRPLCPNADQATSGHVFAGWFARIAATRLSFGRRSRRRSRVAPNVFLFWL